MVDKRSFKTFATNKTHTYRLADATGETTPSNLVKTKSIFKDQVDAIKGGYKHRENEYDDFLREYSFTL